ncbi:MAG TPA: hypothetical protein DDZ51_29305 [Planctomycetaceae bacterium]|nr:hypothetical protein [Planctomycetaceae bacterium]
MPFLHESQIEREADLLLQEFGAKFYEVTKPPVPVDEIVELCLQLVLEYKDMKAIFPFADVHGAIWFEQGTIGIEKSLDPHTNPNRLGRYHFTLAHEVGHWRLHRPYYLKNPAERLLFDDGSPRPDVVCRSSERKRPVEWQADAFAASLLMPKKLIYNAWSEFREGDERPIEIGEIHTKQAGMELFHRGRLASTDEEKDIAAKESYCRPLADLFEVSREAMRIRLETLKLLVRQRAATLF